MVYNGLTSENELNKISSLMNISLEQDLVG